LEKVTRRKGGTVISNPRSNGYSPKPPKAWPAQRPPRQKNKKNPTNQAGAPPTEKQKQKIAAFGSSYTMSASSSAFDLAFDPPATSEG